MTSVATWIVAVRCALIGMEGTTAHVEKAMK